MSLTGKQKKYLLKHIRQKSLESIAVSLGVSSKELQKYLKKRWPTEKYQKIINRSFDKNRDSSKPKESVLPNTLFKKYYWMYLILTLLVIITYANSLPNEFLSDDVAEILNNPRLDHFNYVTSQFLGALRPFFNFIINMLFGRNPLPFRLLNIFSHWGTVLGIFTLVALTISPITGLLAGSLLAVHPLQSEAVSWISGGPYSQSSFFMTASLLAYYLSTRSKKIYCLSVFSFFLALLTSEKAMALFPILFVFIFVFQSLKDNWKKLIPYFVLTVLWAGLFIVKIPERKGILQTVHYQQAKANSPLAQMPIALSSYLELAAWPLPLTLYHSEMHFTNLQFALKIIMVIVFIGMVVYTFFKDRQLFFWLSQFILALTPTILPLGVAWIVAERYVYFGAIGLYVATAILFTKLLVKKKLNIFVGSVFSLIILLLMGRTIIRNRDWKNQDTLWLSAAKYSPSSAQNHNNLGDLYARRGDFTKAAEEFRTAIEINPGYADAIHNLGNVYTQMGENDLAKQTYQKAIDLNPNIWQSYQNMAFLYFNEGDFNTTLQLLEKAVALSPQNAKLYQNIGIVYQQIGDNLKAEEFFQQAISLDPTISIPPPLSQ